MRKLLVLFLVFTAQVFAESTGNNIESEKFIKNCKHALEILQTTRPKLIDLEASRCIDKVFQYSAASYLAKQEGAVSDFCISKEHAFPTNDMKTISVPVKAVTDFVEKYPESLQYESKFIIVAAYSEAFPCES
ncbi:hypothetical protein [Litoribacillus peritrichatus]|uniref:Rap1a immunity protein domain-containing protein n=1 Tax=Litoribacillus peritrichatus TaxID=718191 RepID=A0ABP7MQ26_9GAMM